MSWQQDPYGQQPADAYSQQQQGAGYPTAQQNVGCAYNQAQYPGQQQYAGQQQQQAHGFPGQTSQQQKPQGSGFAEQLAGAQKIYNLVNGKPNHGGGHGSKPNSKVNMLMKGAKMASKYLDKNTAGKANPMATGHAAPAGAPAGGYQQAAPAGYLAPVAPAAAGGGLPGSY